MIVNQNTLCIGWNREHKNQNDFDRAGCVDTSTSHEHFCLFLALSTTQVAAVMWRQPTGSNLGRPTLGRNRASYRAAGEALKLSPRLSARYWHLWLTDSIRYYTYIHVTNMTSIPPTSYGRQRGVNPSLFRHICIVRGHLDNAVDNARVPSRTIQLSEEVQCKRYLDHHPTQVRMC